MRFGFVQRADTTGLTHKVVGSFTVETSAFCHQINLNMENCWAILKDVVETITDRAEHVGDYLYLKDPQAVNYRLIKMVVDEEGDDQGDDNSDEGL